MSFAHGGSEVEWNEARLTDAPVEEEILGSSASRARTSSSAADFAHSLIRARLVDEYRLTVHPVALGDGISLMHGLPEPQRFELISSTAYADGCARPSPRVRMTNPLRAPGLHAGAVAAASPPGVP